MTTTTKDMLAEALRGTAGAHTERDRPSSIGTQLDQGLLEAQLLALALEDGNENEARQKFRALALEYTTAIGVCHAIRNDDGVWDVQPMHTTGRVPRRVDFAGELGQFCESAYERGTIQLRRWTEGFACQIYLAPIKLFAATPEVFVLVLSQETQHDQARQVLERLTSSMTLWFKGVTARKSDWKLASLAALIEMVSRMESAPNVEQACHSIVHDLTKQLGCSQVAIGLKLRKRLRLLAVSGCAIKSLTSSTSRAYLQCLGESILRREASTWPPLHEDQNAHQLLTHKQLARTLQVEAVSSHPLMTLDGTMIGAISLVGHKELVQHERFRGFVKASAPRIACSLNLSRRAEPNRITRGWRRVRGFLLKQKRWRLVTCIVIAVSILLQIPFTYTVRCRCKAEPTLRRFAVAPLNGLIEKGFVKPGDWVEKDQILAQMDGRALRWELASVHADRERALRRREIELANKEISRAQLAELEAKRLIAQADLLEHQLRQLDIVSPIDGIVLSGTLERAEAASVQTGQVLFEIGLLKPLRLEILVPADDIPHVRVGMPVTIWIRGLESRPVRGTILRIRPRSELHDSRNVFVAEIETDNEELQLQPGMEGDVRIDCDRHALGWNLFHKPWEYAVSRLSWW